MPTDADIQNIQQRLANVRAHLARLLREQERLGGHAPPALLDEIRDDRRMIAQLKAVLRAWGLPAPDAEGDAERTLQSAPQSGGGQASGDVQIGDRITVGNVHSTDSNIAIGNRAGGDMIVAQSVNTAGPPSGLDRTLRDLRRALASAQALPPDDAEDLDASLDAAIRAASQAIPNTKRAAGKLAAMQAILGRLAGRAGAAEISALVAQALRQLDGQG